MLILPDTRGSIIKFLPTSFATCGITAKMSAFSRFQIRFLTGFLATTAVCCAGFAAVLGAVLGVALVAAVELAEAVDLLLFDDPVGLVELDADMANGIACACAATKLESALAVAVKDTKKNTKLIITCKLLQIRIPSPNTLKKHYIP